MFRPGIQAQITDRIRRLMPSWVEETKMRIMPFQKRIVSARMIWIRLMIPNMAVVLISLADWFALYSPGKIHRVRTRDVHREVRNRTSWWLPLCRR